jgi:hypothetical protein
VGAAGVELEVELAAAAQLEQVQGQAPPGEEARRVGDGFGVAAVGQGLQLVVESGEEVTDGADEGLPEGQGRPFWRRRWVVWMRTRATVS